jgi:hypothetical protein
MLVSLQVRHSRRWTPGREVVPNMEPERVSPFVKGARQRAYRSLETPDALRRVPSPAQQTLRSEEGSRCRLVARAAQAAGYTVVAT